MSSSVTLTKLWAVTDVLGPTHLYFFSSDPDHAIVTGPSGIRLISARDGHVVRTISSVACGSYSRQCCLSRGEQLLFVVRSLPSAVEVFDAVELSSGSCVSSRPLAGDNYNWIAPVCPALAAAAGPESFHIAVCNFGSFGDPDTIRIINTHTREERFSFDAPRTSGVISGAPVATASVGSSFLLLEMATLHIVDIPCGGASSSGFKHRRIPMPRHSLAYGRGEAAFSPSVRLLAFVSTDANNVFGIDVVDVGTLETVASAASAVLPDRLFCDNQTLSLFFVSETLLAVATTLPVPALSLLSVPLNLKLVSTLLFDRNARQTISFDADRSRLAVNGTCYEVAL